MKAIKKNWQKIICWLVIVACVAVLDQNWISMIATCVLLFAMGWYAELHYKDKIKKLEKEIEQCEETIDHHRMARGLQKF